MIDAIQKNVTWRAIPLAGLIAGTIALLTNLLLTPYFYEIKSGLTLRYIAGLVLGQDVLIEPKTSTHLVGIIVHFGFSLVFAMLIAIVIHRWGLTVGVIGGAVLGLSIYLINLYTMTSFVEWFFAINNNVLALSHVLFGAVVGGVYEMFDHYDEDLV